MLSKLPKTKKLKLYEAVDEWKDDPEKVFGFGDKEVSDALKVLGLEIGVSRSEVSRRVHYLSHKFHPDKVS